MNKFIGIGRLTDDPAINEKNGKKLAKYDLAIDRMKEGADYIRCVCFDRNADFADKYLHKGTKIAITGRVQTGSYTNRDGNKVYTTDIIVETQEFCEKKQEVTGRFTTPPDDFQNPFE